MTTSRTGRPATTEQRTHDHGSWEALGWLAVGGVLLFLVPWLGVDLLELQPDLYQLVWASVVLVLLVAFVGAHRDALAGWWTHNLWASVGIGAVTGALLVGQVLRDTGTDRPHGPRLAFEVVWRGLVYGTVDASALYAFPAAVAWLLLDGDRRGAGRKVRYAVLALGLSMLLTAVYHLGYPEFRGGLLRYPEIGALAANVPIALTANPVGALVAHATMHTAAVAHVYEGGTNHLLPPAVGPDYAARGSADWGVGLAVAWLVVVLGLTVLLRWRDRRHVARSQGRGSRSA